MKFKDMPYTSPDADALRAGLREAAATLRAAQDPDGADAAFRRAEALCSGFDTAYSLCMVRHEIDTRDPYYDAENERNDELAPEIEEARQAFTDALLSSPHRPALEARYGRLLFDNLELDRRTFSPAVIPDLKEESRLVNAYTKLLASAQIDFEGRPHTLPEMMAEKEAADDARRRAAWEADAGFYTAHGEELDRLYDELVRVRTRIARALGFENYVGLGYCRMGRNCYGPEEVARFREAIVRHVVPLADRLYRAQADRLGVPYPLSFPDAALSFRSGNPRPHGTSDEILAHARTLYHELSPETAVFIDELYDNGLLDVLSRPGKGVGGFCTSFPDYGAPFIFANFNGTSDDVETMTHEAGHAYAAFVARDIFPPEYREPTLDACEIHSMTMEFFAWPWAEGFFGTETEKFRYAHLSTALKFLPYGALVDHFQHSVYERPDMSPADRHAEWRRLSALYMPWQAGAGLPFYGEGRGWQRQSHIYQRPFYYIDYCFAQAVSLQFFAAMQQDRAGAFARYQKLVSLAGTKTFAGLCKAAGLPDPFSDAALRVPAEAAAAWLGRVDAGRF